MRIDRISENQIRCYLSKEEMDSRQLRLKELAYGTEKAQKLFHEMMQEAYARYGFSADNMPIMVEAVPLQDESLVLTVTKVDNPEELDTRFSSFAPSVKSGNDDVRPAAPSPLSQLLEAIRQDLDEEQDAAFDSEKTSGRKPDESRSPGASLPAAGTPSETGDSSAPEASSESISSGTGTLSGSGTASGSVSPAGTAPLPANRKEHSSGISSGKGSGKDQPSAFRQSINLFTFPTLGAAADAAGMAGDRFHGQSSLYRDPADSRYYLFLFHDKDASIPGISGVISVFSEFGASEYITPAREQHLREHCDVICASDAVQKLAAL